MELKIKIETEIREDLENGITQKQIWNEINEYLNNKGYAMAKTKIEVKRHNDKT